MNDTQNFLLKSMHSIKASYTLTIIVLCYCPAFAQQEPAAKPFANLSPELKPGIRLEADGKPIDIGSLSSYAHAGPELADVDGDGDRDLAVGDFPGYFWLFENVGNDAKPEYKGRGKLQAGGKDAKTPVY
jgi:hypothetical protein